MVHMGAPPPPPPPIEEYDEDGYMWAAAAQVPSATDSDSSEKEAPATGWPAVPIGPKTLKDAEDVVLGLRWQKATEAEVKAVAAERKKRLEKELEPSSDDDDSIPGLESDSRDDQDIDKDGGTQVTTTFTESSSGVQMGSPASPSAMIVPIPPPTALM